MKIVEFYEAKLMFETDSWDLYHSLQSDNVPIVIDARSKEAFAQEHIPGAVNIPHRTITPERTATLDKHARYVTYCDGIGCNASTKGALNLARLGFQVQELTGGLDWWKRDGYPTEGANASKHLRHECGC